MLVNKNLDDPIPVIKLEMEKLEHDNHKQREAIEWRDQVISTQRLYIQDLKDGKFSPKKTIDPALREEKLIKKKSAVQYGKELEMQKYIEELETRNRKLKNDNDSLRAMEAENQYYCHPRGAIKTEIELLRKEKISNLVEINRLEQEKHSHMLQLSEANEQIRSLRVMKPTSKNTRPHFTMKALSQSNIDGLWVQSQIAHANREKSPDSRSKQK